jgi:RNA polymerase sigma factor (sigma-70 family)
MSSADVILRARRGELAALNHLIEKHKDLAFAVANKIVMDRHAAEDITQEAFIKVFLQIGKFRNESRFSTWLFRIVYNEALRHLRREQKQKETIESSGYSAGAQNEAEGNGSEDREKWIPEALEGLAVNEYVVVSLFYLKEKTVNEIHSITGLSPANIKVLLHRARQKLAVFFNKKINDYE